MENKVISEYTRDLNIEGKDLKAVIKAYEKPIRKTESNTCYVRLEIDDNGTLWGEMNWPAEDITNSESDAIFKDIVKNPDIYKCK